MTGEEVYDDVMKLLSRSDQFGIRIMDPTEEDMNIIKKLYDSNIIPSRSSTITWGVPRKRVTATIVLDKRLGELK